MYVVQNANGKYGVIDSKNNEIIGCKYEDMKFDENSQEFFVTNALSKVGIILANGENKINIEYDSIDILNKTRGLYLVKNNNKYGIVDNDGKIKAQVAYDSIQSVDSKLNLYIVKYNGKFGVIDENDRQIIYWEYDKIGLDTKSFPNEIIPNPYLIYENAIPVQKNQKWGLFDINGKQILNCEYESFGCLATSIIKDKVVNNVLLVPDAECIVVFNGEKYGIINKEGNIFVQYLLDSVYSITSAGKTTYYMDFEYNGEKMEYDVLWYLEELGLYKNPDKEEQAENNNLENTQEPVATDEV